MREWKTRHSRNQLVKKKKGPVEPEKEEEEDKLERFFCHLYEFHNPVQNAPVFVPAELPPRYAINFVPAVSVSPATRSASPVIHVNISFVPVPASVSVPVLAFAVSVPVPASVFVPVPASTAPSTDYSVVSSANFVIASSPDVIVSSSPTTTCIETN